MKNELGKFFIDVAKLILAGVVITTLMQDTSNHKLLVTIIGSTSVISFLIIGLILIKEKEIKK